MDLADFEFIGLNGSLHTRPTVNSANADLTKATFFATLGNYSILSKCSNS